MLDCIGMNRFTSPNKTPITINVMTTWMSGISYSPFGSLGLISCAFVVLLLVLAQLGDRGCATCIGNRFHQAQGANVRWVGLAHYQEGGDNEDSSPESLFQRRDQIPELNRSLWLAEQGILY